MRTGRRCAVVVCAAATLAVAACASREPPDTILLISLDTLRADYLNLYGYEAFETSPSLDAFAQESVVFDSCVVSEPRTLTSHMSLFTGLHPQHHGVTNKAPLRDDVTMLASMLQQRGYETVGIADGGYLHRHWGFARGFDRYEGDRRRGIAAALPDVVEALDRQDSQQGDFRRGFVFLHTYDIHNRGGMVPYYRVPSPVGGRFSAKIDSKLASRSKTEFAERYREAEGELSDADVDYIRATYAEGVRYVDDHLGALFAVMKQRDLFDRALVIVWSDHGEGLFDHEQWTHDQVYDHTIRCTLIVKLPGGVAAGRRVRSVVSAVDVLPSVLELVDGTAPTHLDGHSFLGQIARDTGGGKAFTVRMKNERWFSVRSEDHHLFTDHTRANLHFYDLAEDPEERHNLSPSGSAVEKELRRELFGWMRSHERARSQPAVAAPPPEPAAVEDELRALGYVE